MDADAASPRNDDSYRLADVTRKLLNAFFDVYHDLGAGFLEAVYANVLAIALTHEKVDFAREVFVPVSFRGIVVGAYRADFVLANEIVVELKAASAIERNT
jgi:GxxExxY protein